MKNKSLIILTLSISLSFSAKAQKTDSTFKPHGNLSGQIFGDYYFKAHADSLKRGDFQYSKLDQNANAFQLRRVYLGYGYAISKKFSAKVLMDLTGGTATQQMSFYLKNAYLKWKNILPNTDLLLGEITTPSYVTITGKLWGYRAVEETFSNMHHANSYDLGAMLSGKFGKHKDFGYNIMVGNGRGGLLETDKFKKFYGEVYGKFLNKHIVVDLYADYERLNWDVDFHHSRNTLKGALAYTSKKLTIGGILFTNNLEGDVIKHAVMTDAAIDTLNGYAMGISTFIRGVIVKNKLNFFARYDQFNPNTNFGSTDKYYFDGLSAGYQHPNTVENFIVAGLDFTPTKNVHLMPNVWYQSFSNQNSAYSSSKDFDLVYRLTFFFTYK